MARARIDFAAVVGAAWLALGPESASAQLVLDGSLGPAQQIHPDAANEFQITDAHGAFSAGGENRFHSFSQFDLLDPNQAAVFSSLQSPERVIVRVMQRAQIDAGLRSTIPGADLYLLSPLGISFGPNARLDVKGSFHASSADVLRFPEGPGADLATGSAAVPAILSSAAPAAFGFTRPSPGSISLNVNDFVFGAPLSVPPGETLSLIGGEVRMQSFSGTNVRAPGATVQIAAVAGPAEIPHALETLEPAALPAPPAGCPGAGCVTLSNNAAIDLSSPSDGSIPAGRIVIRAGRFRMLGSSDLTAVERSAPGTVPGRIDVAVNGAIEIAEGALIESATESHATGPAVALEAPLVALEGGRVVSETRGAGRGGAIAIEAGTLRIANETAIAEGSFVSSVAGAGAGGDLTVSSTNVELTAGGQLRADTVGSGSAGRLQVIDADVVTLDGVDAQERPSSITARALETATGAARDLAIETRILAVENGAQISTATFGAGSAGNLVIGASESVTIRGGENGAAVVSAASRLPGDLPRPLGPSGNLAIAAPTVVLADGGQVSVSTGGTRAAGNLSIEADHVSISGADPIGNPSGVFAQSNLPDPSPGGAGGDITIGATGDIVVADGGRVSVQTRGAGKAGRILLDAGRAIRVDGGSVEATTLGSGLGGRVDLVAGSGASITDGGVIAARAQSTGNAGDIAIDAGPRLEVVRASITTEAQNASGGSIDITARDAVVLQDAQITTSVLGGAGGGGDIAIDPDFVILDNSQIIARAIEGAGGNIRIRAGTLLSTPDSLIDASSQLGIDGNVVIDSPNSELTGKLAVLPQNFLNASALLADPCLARTATEGSFVVRSRGIAPPPDAALTPESGEPPACSPPPETP